MKRSGTKSAFNEAYRFVKDPRPFEVKSEEYDRTGRVKYKIKK